ncbi:MAG TPA: metallophosphoesterase, partial [Cytophagaceae bacterium]|nr:metallophosphoesterase [Cytophagaceae bacterium]
IPDSISVDFSLYLIGDAGDPILTSTEPVFKLLKSNLEKDSNSAVVFLGDNIYYNGLVSEENKMRPKMEKKINEQLSIVENYKGQVFFISGNHDWDNMMAGGLDAIKREEVYVEEKLKRGNTFVPDFGCPGPFKVNISKNIVLIAIDSQWWLHKKNKPYGRCGNCDAEDEEDVLVQLQDIIEKNKGRNIVIAAHHPLVSNGNHGGYFSAMDYFFPLKIVRKSGQYIPIPVLGALYPLFRKFGGSEQDLSSYKYQAYKNGLMNIFKNYDNLIFAAGHDHNLQYHKIGTLHQIISGSGSKLNDLTGGNEATFAQKQKGYAKIVYMKNGDVWTEYWNPEKDGSSGKLIFRTKLYSKKELMPESFCSLSHTDYTDSTITLAANTGYKRSKAGRLLLGDHYRTEWSTPVTVNYLDLQKEKGGLIPYAKGGRKQTASLKVRNLDDQEFKLRTVNKESEKILPEEYRNSVVEDLVADQISAQHPYGAITVTPIAEAAGVLHTNPKLVYIPNDDCLGPYRDEFKGKIMFFEEDPNGNHEEADNLGNSKHIVGTDKVKEKIEGDHNNKVDENSFCRARLLDMLLGDWDRHDKQFRWASFENKKEILYVPIPEDRDQVYFKFDGIIPFILSRTWSVNNLQNFGYDYKDIIGLNKSAASIDRRFLSTISETEWIAIADSLKLSVTDKVIEDAIHRLPESIFKIHGDEIISKLKSRRDKLPDAAKAYYRVLAKYVNVYTSNKNEKFVVQRLNDNETKVSIYKIGKDGETKHKIFERIFYRKQTKEVRLYGLSGNDIFTVTGNTKKGIKIRIIGGDGNDTITDQSKVAGIPKKTIVYDNLEGNQFNLNRETNREMSKDPAINNPSQDKFFYNYLGPQATLFYNQDDGLFAGGGFLYKRYKFRRTPYAEQHRLMVSVATNTGSKKVEYEGDIKGLFLGLDLGIKFLAYTPAFVINYFGYGNESKNLHQPIPFNRVRLNKIIFNPSINKTLTSFFTVGIGPKFERYRIDKVPGVYIDTTLALTDQNLFAARQYGGVRSFFRLGTKDSPVNPKRGMLWTAEANWMKEFKSGNSTYSQYLSDFIFYISPNLPFQLTFAGRIGGGLNYGDFQFYQANTLGMTDHLRGFRKTRFVGDKSFYQNFETRLQVLKFNAYLFPGKLGILGFIDNGRVWARGERSDTWHTGYGGGLWASIFDKFIVTTTYALSAESHFFNFKLGFFY